MKSWKIEVQKIDGEMILPLSEEILKETGWKIGDTIEWIDNKDGSWSMKVKKQEKLEWVLVDTVSQFRMRYMIQVPVGKKEWALDTVTMSEGKEFSQVHIGETIVSHRVVTEAEALQICDEDNDYCKSWSDDKKIEVFFTKENEKRED